MNEPTGSPAPWLRALRQALPIVLLLLMLPGMLHPLRHSIAVMQYVPWALDREEGFLLAQAVALRAGDTIYPSLTSYPLTVGNYPPVYPSIHALLLPLFDDGLAAGRLVTLLGALACGVASILLSWRGREILGLALLAPCLFLTTWDWNNWIVFARVDILALAFGVLGFLIALRGSCRLSAIAAAILLAIAFHCKQTQLIAPAAAVGALLLCRQWQRAALITGVSAGLALTMLLVLVLLTGGEAWRHLVVYNANEFDWSQLRSWWRHLFHFERIKLVSLAMLVIAAIPCAKLLSPLEIRLHHGIAIYTLLAFLSLIQLAKIGSAANYLLEFHVAVACVMTLLIGTILLNAHHPGLPTLQRRIAQIFGYGGIAVLLIHSTMLWTPSRMPLRPPIPTAEWAGSYPDGEVVLELLSAPEPVLCDYPSLTIMAGKPVLFQPFILSRLEQEKRWAATAFITDLESGHFSRIITVENLESDGVIMGWSEPLRDALLRGYTLKRVIGEGNRSFFVYQPRGK